MKRFNEVKDLILSLEGDFEKFYDKQNQAAGTRVRKGMQEQTTTKTPHSVARKFSYPRTYLQPSPCVGLSQKGQSKYRVRVRESFLLHRD